MTIEHNEMTYFVIQTGEGYDVHDAAGTRPLGLRDQGPWDTEDEAAAAVLAMTPAESRE